MLIKRILTALIGIPVVVLLLHFGGYPFAAGIFFLAAAALFEVNNMAAKKGAGIYLFSSLFFALLLCFTAIFYQNAQIQFFICILATVFIMLKGVISYKLPFWLEKNLYSAFAFLYISVFFSTFILFREFGHNVEVPTVFGLMTEGEVYLWLCILGTWLSDTFAYFVGVLFGKHKLFPAISPNKSWEGALGGFAFSIVGVGLLGKFVFYGQAVHLLCLGLLIGFLAPLGDLVESQIKRYFAVKDSGSIFPGHGGVLDRLDSLLLVIPVVYVYLNFALR